MNGINQEIKNILDLQAQANGIQVNARNVLAQANDRMSQLRERIKRGETTGDRIKDFVIAYYGFLDEEIEGVYRDLEARIRQHIGEFILMITKEENFYGCTGFGYKPKDRDYVLDERLSLGILTDGKLVLSPADDKCELPVGGKHVQCWNAWCEKVGLVEENIISDWRHDFGLSLNKQLERKSPVARLQKEPDLDLEMKMGDDEVKAWFEKKGGCYLVVFQKASRLLGREIEESPQLAAELQRRRKAVAKRLVELVGERSRLKQKIARIFGAVGGLYSPDGVSVAICETEYDARIISMGPRQRLKEVENEIKKQLKIALELNMGSDQFIQELCQQYQIRG